MEIQEQRRGHFDSTLSVQINSASKTSHLPWENTPIIARLRIQRPCASSNSSQRSSVDQTCWSAMGAASVGSASTAMERQCACDTASYCWSQARPLPPVRNPLRKRSPLRGLCTSHGLLEQQRGGDPDQWRTPKPQHGARYRCQANPRNSMPHTSRPYQDAVSSTPPEMEGPAVSAGPLERKDFPNFVHFFRQASSYIKGHRDRVFVIVVPGEVGVKLPALCMNLSAACPPPCSATGL